MIYRNQHFLVIVSILVLAVPVLLILQPYFTALILAGVLAIFFSPVFNYLKRWLKSGGWSAFLTVLIAITIVLAPFFSLGYAAFGEAKQLYIEAATDQLNLNWLNQRLSILETSLKGWLPTASLNFDANDLFAKLFDWLIVNLSVIFSGLAVGLFILLVSLFIFFYFLKDGSVLKKALIDISPLRKDYSETIFIRIKDSVNAVVRGSILIALIQGGVSIAGFFIFDIPNPVLLGAVTALSSLIPSVGVALVFVPVIIYALLSKSLLMSLGIALWGLLIVGLIDNFVRPYLVEKGSGLHPAVVFLSVLGGILVFGPLGFIIGPVIFSVFFALLDLYAALGREEAN